MRMPRSAREGLRAARRGKYGSCLSPPISRIRRTTLCGCMRAAVRARNSYCSSSVGNRPLTAKANSVRYKPTPSACTERLLRYRRIGARVSNETYYHRVSTELNVRYSIRRSPGCPSPEPVAWSLPDRGQRLGCSITGRFVPNPVALGVPTIRRRLAKITFCRQLQRLARSARLSRWIIAKSAGAGRPECDARRSVSLWKV
jgi:hypothetical protein